MVKNKSSSKVTNALIYSMAIISIIGFIGIMANAWLGFEFILNNSSAYMLIILGLGLSIEGQIKRWKKFPQDGFDSDEIAHIVTGIIGILAVFVGILDLIGLSGSSLDATKAIVSLIAVVIIILQTWIIK